MNLVFPIEIIDRIYSYCDLNTIKIGREFQSKQFQQLTKYNNISDAIRSFNIKNIKWLKGYGKHNRDSDIRIACEISNLEILEFLYNEGYEIGYYAMECAAQKVNLEVIQWLYHNLDLEIDYCSCRSENEHIEEEGYCECGDSIFNIAARNCHFDLMQWLFEKEVSWDINTFSAAALGGDLEIMVWLLEIDCFKDTFTICKAAENGNLLNLQWLLDNDFPRNGMEITYAIYQQDLNTIAWLISNDFFYDRWTFLSAIEVENTEILDILYGLGCEIHSMSFSHAADQGKLKSMEWFYDKKIPFGQNTMEYAARNGNLENIKWLHEIGCTWNKCTLRDHSDIPNFNEINEFIKQL